MNHPYPLSRNEDLRLNVLHSHGILDTSPEAAFDRLTSIAARTAEVEISLVSLVDRDRQFFKSCFGANLQQTPREQSFCAHAVVNPSTPLIIEDARKDPRTEENSLVLGPPYIRFYAGFPITDRDSGLALGTLCVISTEPKSLSEEQIDSLKDLAEIVEDELELRLKKKQLAKSEKKFRGLYQTSQEEIEHLRSNLLHVVSHELRTPLNAVVGVSDLLQSDWENMDKEEIAEMLDHVNRGGLRLTTVVERITLFAELKIHEAYAKDTVGSEASTDIFREGACTVEEAVERAIEAVATLRPQSDSRADLEVDLEDAMIAVPESRLGSALREVIDNALKFSTPGSKVEIQGRGDSEGYTLSVTDQGPGLSEEQKSRISALVQFDRGENEQQGWGLGLALVLQLGRVFNFTLSFDNTEPSGTTASLRLPPVFSSDENG